MAVLGEGSVWPQTDVLQPIADCLAGRCGGLIVEHDIIAFLVMVIGLGGLCAFLAGRSSARSWAAFSSLVINMVLFGFAIRFLEWGIFRGTLLQPYYYLVHTAILIAIAALGFQLTRTNQMVTQYHWLYQRSGPLTWKSR